MYSKLHGETEYEDVQNQLHVACKSGTIGDVIRCLKACGSNIQWYHEGETLFHGAILSGRKDICEVITALLDNGANINAQNYTDGNTALHLTVLHGMFPRNLNLIKYLLERKVDLAIRNKSLRTAYDCAIATGQYELARTLDGSWTLEQALKFYTEKIGKKYGPYIIEAVLANDMKRLRRCIELGGNPNTVNKHRAGAIHYTVTHSKLPVYDTLSILLEAGADPNLRDDEGDTALNLVIKSDYLRDNGQTVRCVQLLVNAGAKCDICDWDGKDAHNLAEERGYEDVINILRKKKPGPKSGDVNSPNENGLYPIHEAISLENSSRRHTKINTLILKGAEVSKQIASTGNTALHLCAEKNYDDTATVLLAHHIDYTLKNNQGKTAYETAKEMGHDSVALAIQRKQDGVKDNWNKAKKKTKFCVIL